MGDPAMSSRQSKSSAHWLSGDEPASSLGCRRHGGPVARCRLRHFAVAVPPPKAHPAMRKPDHDVGFQICEPGAHNCLRPGGVLLAAGDEELSLRISASDLAHHRRVQILTAVFERGKARMNIALAGTELERVPVAFHRRCSARLHQNTVYDLPLEHDQAEEIAFLV